MNEISYSGNELELFSRAKNWRNYWTKLIDPHIEGNVLEVGAGIGSTTLALSESSFKSWTCVEPDGRLSTQLTERLNNYSIIKHYEIINGTLEDVLNERKYNTILYIDVLEHIEDDEYEITSAIKYLADSGKIIILSPAQQWLFSEFDKVIGHFRRYTRKSLMTIMPKELKLINIRYLDSVGLMASLANRICLHSSSPTLSQIAFWDNLMIPCSRLFDPLIGYSVGKSILGVWRI